jgi:hypothetical protein
LEDASSDRSVVVIITRPPEIVACLKTRIADRDVYIVFDSHPRPDHPDGLGLIINPSIKMAASYLSDLLSFDEDLLRDPSLQWQAQLLGYFSGHILLPLEEEPSATEMLLESSMALLSSYADVAYEKSRVSELREKVQELERQHHFMEERVKHLERRRREEYEQYRDTIRSHEREREKYLKGGTSRSRNNSFHPPPTFSSSSSSSRQSAPAENSEDGWQVVGKKDKGKGRMEHVLSYGLSLPRPWNQNHTSSASNAHPANPPPPSPKNHYSTPFDQKTMPGGLSDPLATDYEGDIAVALKLQQEYEEENEQLMGQREMLEVTAQATFECSICFDKYPEDSVARVEECEHSFCRDCLRGHARSKIGERRFPIFCPLCTTDKNRLKQGGEYGGLSDIRLPIESSIQIFSCQ